MSTNTRKILVLFVLAVALSGVWRYRENNKNTMPTPLVDTIPEAVSPESTSGVVETDTTSWHTYTNDEFKFSLSYPDHWRKVEGMGVYHDGTLQFFNYPADKYVGGEMLQTGDAKLELVVVDKPTDQVLQAFVKESAQSGLGADKTHIIESVQLKQASAVTDEIKDDASYKSYYVELSDTKVLILTISPQTADPEVASILSSLKTH